jgi:hypothetical protein
VPSSNGALRARTPAPSVHDSSVLHKARD